MCQFVYRFSFQQHHDTHTVVILRWLQTKHIGILPTHGKNFQGPSKVTPENPIQHLEKGSIIIGVLRKSSSNSGGGGSSRRSRSSSSSSRLFFLHIACRVYCNGRYQSWLVHKNHNWIMAGLGYDLIVYLMLVLASRDFLQTAGDDVTGILCQSTRLRTTKSPEHPMRQRTAKTSQKRFLNVIMNSDIKRKNMQKSCFPVVVHRNKLLTYLAEMSLSGPSSERSWSAWLGV